MLYRCRILTKIIYLIWRQYFKKIIKYFRFKKQILNRPSHVIQHYQLHFLTDYNGNESDNGPNDSLPLPWTWTPPRCCFLVSRYNATICYLTLQWLNAPSSTPSPVMTSWLSSLIRSCFAFHKYLKIRFIHNKTWPTYLGQWMACDSMIRFYVGTCLWQQIGKLCKWHWIVKSNLACWGEVRFIYSI